MGAGSLTFGKLWQQIVAATESVTSKIEAKLITKFGKK
jgi:hypothetical protein